MKHMKKIIITLALFCLTTSTAYADSEDVSAVPLTEILPIQDQVNYTEEEKAFRLDVPQMAMDIRNFIDTLRENSNFDGTAIVIKNDIVVHRSGDLSALAKSPDMALHYESSLQSENSPQISKYEWVDTINDLEHHFELESDVDGPVVLSKRNFDKNTTILILSHSSNQDALAFASEIEAQLN
ncbi:hypothetical protein [Fusibacter sp. JL216-2]|uniref:hypothetical protein n=1 Tax=Fusibacter sp. JL216-2 TaxID=3071453 RepID=UPI003D32CABF